MCAQRSIGLWQLWNRILCLQYVHTCSLIIPHRWKAIIELLCSLAMTSRDKKGIRTHMYISVFSICMHRHTQKYRGYTGFLRYEMLFYIHLLWQNSQSPTLICSMSCEMQTVLIVEAVVMVRAEPHRQVWRGVSFFDHRYGTPKGQAEGPEKPAAWDYYFQPGAAQERQVSKRGVSSSSLSSSASPKHSDSHRHHTHTQRHLLLVFYTLLSHLFVPVGL